MGYRPLGANELKAQKEGGTYADDKKEPLPFVAEHIFNLSQNIS
jgi:hypothetical protein